MTDPRNHLSSAVRRLARLRAPRPRPPAHDLMGRLDHVERELGEVRTRINALFFTVLAVALGEVVSRVVAG